MSHGVTVDRIEERPEQRPDQSQSPLYSRAKVDLQMKEPGASPNLA